MLRQFPCHCPAKWCGQQEDKAQAEPSNTPEEHSRAEMQFHGVWQRLSQAQDVFARGNQIALNENSCMDGSVAKIKFETLRAISR